MVTRRQFLKGIGLSLLSVPFVKISNFFPQTKQKKEVRMPYEAKNFDHLLGTPGFSDQLLKNHFTLYQGDVTNTNKLADTLAQMLKEGKAGTPEYAELKRRFGWGV
jgi:Fe-Mn family superoxide dismutase